MSLAAWRESQMELLYLFVFRTKKNETTTQTLKNQHVKNQWALHAQLIACVFEKFKLIKWNVISNQRDSGLKTSTRKRRDKAKTKRTPCKGKNTIEYQWHTSSILCSVLAAPMLVRRHFSQFVRFIRFTPGVIELVQHFESQTFLRIIIN